MGLDLIHQNMPFLFANETSKLSGFNELEYITSDETYLDQLESNSFDGVICSNFLDVIPKELSDQIIKKHQKNT